MPQKNHVNVVVSYPVEVGSAQTGGRGTICLLLPCKQHEAMTLDVAGVDVLPN